MEKRERILSIGNFKKKVENIDLLTYLVASQ